MCYEVDLKYGGREISEGSLVSSRSKDDLAGDEPLPSKSTNHNLGFPIDVQPLKINQRESARQL